MKRFSGREELIYKSIDHSRRVDTTARPLQISIKCYLQKIKWLLFEYDIESRWKKAGPCYCYHIGLEFDPMFLIKASAGYVEGDVADT